MHSSPRTLPWFRIGTVVTLTLVASAAYASQNGIVGRSGKQGQSCNQCHNTPNGAVAPTVALTGPTTLDAGAKGIYTFTVTTTNAATGMNAAATDGVLAANVANGNVQAVDLDGVDEVTHTAPLDVTDAGGGQGVSTYRFELTAPAFGGPITLYAAGNAVDKSGDTTGDISARTMMAITVNGPARPQDAGRDATPAPQPTTPAPVPTTTVPPGPSSTSAPPGNDAGVARSGARPTAEDDDGGCSIGWADRSSTPGGAMIGTLVALAAYGRARSRRRSEKK